MNKKETLKLIERLYEKSLRKRKNMASLKKMDLHIHSPASEDYVWKNKKNEIETEYRQFIECFLDTDLDVIAITDHNTINGYEEVIKLKENDSILKHKLKEKLILPGVEITCLGRHFLIYFSEKTDIDKIKRFLKECGIEESDGKEKSSADRVTPLTLCELADQYGGIVVLPHADDDKGFLKDYLKNGVKDEISFSGGIVEKVLKCKNLLGICIKNETNKERMLQILNNYPSKIKIFKASDSHSSYSKEEYNASGKPMGTQFFYANIGKPNFRTLKLFFSNPDATIVEEKIEKQNPVLLSVCINDGFIKDKELSEKWAVIPFSEELNCLIGARGTGKSTIIDIIKYIFNFFDNELYFEKADVDEYIISQKEEKKTGKSIITRFKEVIAFLKCDKEIFAIYVAPKNFNIPNVHVFKLEGESFAEKEKFYKINKDLVSEYEKLFIDTKPIIYQQKNILDIGNSKIKVTNAINDIIGKIEGEEYKKLVAKSIKLKKEVKRICERMANERRLDKRADNNNPELKAKYEELLKNNKLITEKNIGAIERINSVLGERLRLEYNIGFPKSYVREMISDIIFGNRKERDIHYEEIIKLEKQYEVLFSKINEVPNLLYLLFTKQSDELEKIMGLPEKSLENASEWSYKYITGECVSWLPQVVIDFKLNVNYGTKNKAIYIERKKLSFGQRAVGILLIILYGTMLCSKNQPIILDQPEDDLDNSYVYHVLVKDLEKVKEKRQLIIATHSPNIAVAGNSENILVLKGNGQNGWIESLGTIHNEDISRHAIEILEGNEIAFKKRAELYDIK